MHDQLLTHSQKHKIKQIKARLEWQLKLQQAVRHVTLEMGSQLSLSPSMLIVGLLVLLLHQFKYNKYKNWVQPEGRGKYYNMLSPSQFILVTREITLTLVAGVQNHKVGHSSTSPLTKCHCGLCRDVRDEPPGNQSILARATHLRMMGRSWNKYS